MNKKLIFVEANTTGTGMLAIQKAIELGYDPIFLTSYPERYQGLSDLKCRVIEIETNSLDVLKRWLFLENVSEIAGIMTTSDYYLETVAELVQMMGRKGNSPDTIRTCRNKALFRQSLCSSEVRQPRFQIVRSIDELKEIQPFIDLPWIVKPADDSGSNHVRLCSTWEEVEQLTATIFSKKRNARGQETAHTVLLEEYIDGPEFSVEMFSWDGVATCIGITEKRVTGFPYFVESGHIFPAELSENIRLEIERTVKCALEAVDFQYGASHSEVKWTSDGCVMIEINARLAGGMIPELVTHSTEIDLLKQQILQAVGSKPEWKTIHCKGYAGIHFLIVEEMGALSQICGAETVRTLAGVEDLQVKANIGQAVQPAKNFSHRLGHVIVRGETYQETVDRLEQAAQILKLKVHQERE